GVQAFSSSCGYRRARQATLDYLTALWNAPDPWIQSVYERGENPKLPQFPVETEVALLRQMNAFDRDGNLVATPITESLQVRVFHKISGRSDRPDIIDGRSPAREEQDVFEIRLSQVRSFPGNTGGLRAVDPGETEFATFQTHGMDAFEFAAERHEPAKGSVILNRCVACHSQPGILSLQSLKLLLKPNRAQVDPQGGNDPNRNFGQSWWQSNDVCPGRSANTAGAC
ncbi:MAG: hypothetical protein WA324_28905, partial [Bryobacteraceae bacterium]